MLLYVEDDERSMRTGLRLIGPDVIVRSARSVTEALERLGDKLPCAALIDVELPEGQFAGLELLRKLRTMSPTLPVGIMTGRLDPVVINAALVLNADMIGKPAGPEVFTKFVLKIPSLPEAARLRHQRTERDLGIATHHAPSTPVHPLGVHAGIDLSALKHR